MENFRPLLLRHLKTWRQVQHSCWRILPSLHEHAPLQNCLCEWNPMHTSSSQQSQFAPHILPPSSFDFLLVCHLLAPFHKHMLPAFLRHHGVRMLVEHRGSPRLYRIINWHDLDQLDFFQSVVSCCFLSSRHFNFVTRLFLSLQSSFLQLCAVFASFTLI